MSLPIFKSPLVQYFGAFFICFFGANFANPRSMKFIVLRLYSIFVLLFILGSGLRAQLGSGTQKSDEPLFSHQYTFIDDPNYYFIDTSFNSLHWYHQGNARGKDNFEYSVLGSMGTPMNTLTYPEVGDVWDYYSLGAYQPYFQRQNNLPFYYSRSPITEANYWMGYDRGQNFNIYHTQNINKNWNAQLNYNRLNDLGFYTHNRNIKSRFLANTSYRNEKVGYEAKAYFIAEKMLTEENGGLVNDSTLENTGARVLLNVNLLRDSRTLRRQEFYIDQNYALNKLFERDIKKDTLQRDSTDNEPEKAKDAKGKIAIGHTFKYTLMANSYSGSASDDFYTNYFTEPEGDYTDSSGYRSYANMVYLLTQVGRTTRFDLKVGLKNLITEYGGEGYRFSSGNWGLTGNIGGKVAERVNVSANLDYILTGNLKESFDFNAQGNLKLFEWLRAFGGYQLSSKFPEFFESVYYSNNYIWENRFEKELVNKVNYGVGWGKGNQLEITNYIVNNYVYFNENVQPVQSNDAVNVFRAKLIQNFTIWNFLHQDNQIYYQTVGGNSAAMPLPELVSRNSLYFEFNLFKKVLKCLVGAEMKYFTSYNSPSYDPATGRFFNAMEQPIGDYPLIDVFANFELRSARIFVKYEHVNEGLNGYRYFAAPNYPFPDRVLRIGITWRFFN